MKDNVKKSGIKKGGQWVFYGCMVAIPLLHFLVFYVYVNFNSILLAFKTYDREITDFVWNSGAQFFDNFATVFRMFFDPTYAPSNFSQAMGSSFKNSFLILILGWAIRSPLGWMFSWYIYKQKFGSPVFRIILYLPQIISSVTMITMFVPVMDLVIPNLLSNVLGYEGPSLISGSNTFGAYLFYYCWSSFGGSVLIYSGTMSSISESIIEAAEVDGVTPFKEFTRIVLPIIWPTIATFIVVGVAQTFTDQFNLFTFDRTEAYPEHSTVGYYLYQQMKKGDPTTRYPVLSAMGVSLTFITVPFVILIRWLTNKVNPMEN